MAGFSDERIRALVLGTKAFRTIDFPGRPGLKIAIRALSEREIDACRVEAQAQFRRQCEARNWKPESANELDSLMIARLVERQVLWRATFDPETIGGSDPRPFFPGDSDVADLDSTTCQMLWDEYVDHREWVAPKTSLSDAQVEEMVDALGKAPEFEGTLTQLDHASLRRFAISTVRLLATYRTGRSSTSSTA